MAGFLFWKKKKVDQPAPEVEQEIVVAPEPIVVVEPHEIEEPPVRPPLLSIIAPSLFPPPKPDIFTEYLKHKIK